MSDAVPVAEVLRRLDHRALLDVRSTRSRADIEDARSEFYVALLEGRARWNGEGSLLAWARRVVLNIAADGLGPASWREVPVERPGDDPDLWHDPALWESVMSGAGLELAAERRCLRALLERLSPKQRRALELDLVGHTADEIAGRFGVSAHAVRKVLRKARAELERHHKHSVRAVLANSGAGTRGGSSPSGSFLLDEPC